MALAQIGFLGWIIAGRAAVLRDGREIVLKVEPVDPRDLLRGDYVRLGYEISSIPAEQITNIPPDSKGRASELALCAGEEGRRRLLAPAVGDFRRAAAGGASARRGRHQGPRRGEAGASAPDTSIEREYGIDRFYLPEGEGLDLEKDMRVRPFGVRVALASDGTAQIKALLDGDKPAFRGAALLGGE